MNAMKHMLLASLLALTAAQAADTKLWYDQPAANWIAEALPIGNGDLGAMVFGKTDIERIQFNEKSLWTGNEQDVGSYQPFGDLFLKLDHDKPQEYRRELDLERGVQTVRYLNKGVRYRRELFASNPDGVIAIRLTADKPGALSGKLWLTDMHGADVLADASTHGKRLTATGVLNNGMDYESQVLVLNSGGTVEPGFEPGFDNKPVPRVRPEVPVLDGSKDIYLSLRGSDRPVFDYFDKRNNDDAMPGGAPLVLNGEWFDRGISFQAPNDFSFILDGKYRWLTFHAQVAEEGVLKILVDGKIAREIPAGTETQYVAIPVAGAKVLKIEGLLVDPKSNKGPGILLGHLRLSPAQTPPAKDAGIARGGKAIPGFKAQIPPVALSFNQCDSVTILLGAKTSYLADHSKGWRGPQPHEALSGLMDKAGKEPFVKLLAAHEKDYRSLFGRVSLNLGKVPPEVSSLPTDQRFARYAKGEADPGFESLVFQFGRYLLISSSRMGGLPANLQGVWNQTATPPWRGDYHTDIDLQMNYWPAELTNLAECHVPFFDFLAAQAPVYRKTMLTDPEMLKRFPNHRGWAIRCESGVFGATAYYEMNIPVNAWYCQHLWQHFEFGQDREFLRAKAYPMMKETCEFWIDHLVTMPNGQLATPDGWSAEWKWREPAVTYDQELIWDLLNNTVAAADVLGTDKEFRNQIAGIRDKLVTPSIGKHGQLKEWFEDKDDMTSTYRHISHLWAVYPGKQIALQETPEWAAAAKVSLNARTDDTPSHDSAGGVGWSLAWKMNVWARLRDAERCYTLVRKFVRPVRMVNGKPSPDNYLGANLINRSYQLEGPWGFTAGIAEMLLQSHLGEVELLPALPKAWPTGSVKGLRARGNFTVDIEWKDGKVINYRIASPEPREVKVRVNGETKAIQSEKL